MNFRENFMSDIKLLIFTAFSTWVHYYNRSSEPNYWNLFWCLYCRLIQICILRLVSFFKIFIIFTKTWFFKKIDAHVTFVVPSLIYDYGHDIRQFQKSLKAAHCVKSVRIWTPEKMPNKDVFHTVAKNDIREQRLTLNMKIFPILAQNHEKRDIDHANASTFDRRLKPLHIHYIHDYNSAQR